jgi:DNA-binding MarR family transcriptional regulator
VLVLPGGGGGRGAGRPPPHDVPAATLRLLSQVEELGPITIGHLADADRCSQPTMSSAVQNLVDKGWAAKQPNPADARSSLVHLTDAGREVLGSTRRKNAEVVAVRLAADPQHDVQDLETAVALLRGLLDQHPEEGSK